MVLVPLRFVQFHVELVVQFHNNRYNNKLVVAEKAGIKKAITGGISMGVFFMIMASAEAIAFW